MGRERRFASSAFRVDCQVVLMGLLSQQYKEGDVGRSHPVVIREKVIWQIESNDLYHTVQF